MKWKPPFRGHSGTLGYPDLVRDDSHSDALLEGDPAALEVLWREFAKRPDWKTPLAHNSDVTPGSHGSSRVRT